jgi:hypothetical protein
MGGIQFTAIYPDGPGSAAAGGEGGPAGSDVNPLYPGMPVGATPVHKDNVYTAAGTYPLWAPSSGMRFVLTSAFLVVSAAGRVALVDDLDIPGSRPVDGDFGANGGATPNLVPVPYPSKTAGNPLRVVTTVAGNTRVRVSGWEVPA